jgi:hypothetical protein
LILVLHLSELPAAALGLLTTLTLFKDHLVVAVSARSEQELPIREALHAHTLHVGCEHP